MNYNVNAWIKSFKSHRHVFNRSVLEQQQHQPRHKKRNTKKNRKTKRRKKQQTNENEKSGRWRVLYILNNKKKKKRLKNRRPFGVNCRRMQRFKLLDERERDTFNALMCENVHFGRVPFCINTHASTLSWMRWYIFNVSFTEYRLKCSPIAHCTHYFNYDSLLIEISWFSRFLCAKRAVCMLNLDSTSGIKSTMCMCSFKKWKKKRAPHFAESKSMLLWCYKKCDAHDDRVFFRFVFLSLFFFIDRMHFNCSVETIWKRASALDKNE